MSTAPNMIEIFWQSFFIFLFNSFLFDCCHFLLHKTNNRWHQAHHLFFDADLQINSVYRKKNLLTHVLFEFAFKFLSCFIFLICFSGAAVGTAALVEVMIVIYVFINRGEDPNHRSLHTLLRPLYRPYVTASYHALHHQYPRAYFSSHHFLFDGLFGTACLIKGRTFLVTGSDGAFGCAMVCALKQKGAIVYEWLPNSRVLQNVDKPMLAGKLTTIDVLVMAHGSKYDSTQANNMDSQKWLVKHFLLSRKSAKILPEVWGVGSELEFCSHLNIRKIQDYVLSKRAYARFALRLYGDRNLLYRHIVPSSFTSKMGKGLMSANFTARLSLFLIMRGVRYIPISYTGIAYLNYYHFLCCHLERSR